MVRFRSLAVFVALLWLVPSCNTTSKQTKAAPADPCKKPAEDTRGSKDDSRSNNTRTATGSSSSSRYKLVADPVTWDNDIEPIVRQYCIACHARGATQPALDRMPTSRRDLQEIVSSVAGRRPSMPKAGPLSSRNQQLFLDWQQGGFLEKSTGSVGRDDARGSNGELDDREGERRGTAVDDDPYDNKSNRSTTRKNPTTNDRVTRDPCQ